MTRSGVARSNAAGAGGPAADLAERVALQAGTAAALVALADGAGGWQCTLHGLEGSEGAGAVKALALQTLLLEQPWIVADALEDPTLRHHPAVVRSPWIRRLLGVPIRAVSGRVLGCLCAIDFEPGAPSTTTLVALRDLADVEALGQERQELARELRRQRRQRLRGQAGPDPARVAEEAGLLQDAVGPRLLESSVCLQGLEALFSLRAAEGFALLRLDCRDVDRFAATVGMEGLAALMAAVADRITAILPRQASFCRYGEEEFLLLVPRLADANALVALAAELVKAVSAPYRIASHSLPLAVAVGAAQVDGSFASAAALLSEVGVARRLAASGGGAGFRLVDASMRRQVREDFARQSRFREALQQGGLVPFFQPIVDLINGRPLGFEALARWRDQDGQYHSPSEFLPVARQIGLTGELDLVVITQVLAALPALVAAAGAAVVGPLLMSVNLSAQLLDSAELRQRLLDLIEAHPLPPFWQLQVELLEEALQESNQGLDAFLARLAVLKVGIAIDDFGTGYSSLARLDSLPIQAFKIDRSFVERLNDGLAPSNQLLRTMNTLATDMGLAATAEGVETVMQRDWLRHSGFLSGQGYYFARPLSLEQAEAYLRAQCSSDDPLPPPDPSPQTLPEPGFWGRLGWRSRSSGGMPPG